VRLLLREGASATALNSHDMTPMDEALLRDRQDIVTVINEFNAPSKEVDEEDDVPDDAEEADEGADVAMDEDIAAPPDT
jgi:ankyrin repeat protein